MNILSQFGIKPIIKSDNSSMTFTYRTENIELFKKISSDFQKFLNECIDDAYSNSVELGSNRKLGSIPSFIATKEKIEVILQII